MSSYSEHTRWTIHRIYIILDDTGASLSQFLIRSWQPVCDTMDGSAPCNYSRYEPLQIGLCAKTSLNNMTQIHNSNLNISYLIIPFHGNLELLEWQHFLDSLCRCQRPPQCWPSVTGEPMTLLTGMCQQSNTAGLGLGSCLLFKHRSHRSFCSCFPRVVNTKKQLFWTWIPQFRVTVCNTV